MGFCQLRLLCFINVLTVCGERINSWKHLGWGTEELESRNKTARPFGCNFTPSLSLETSLPNSIFKVEQKLSFIVLVDFFPKELGLFPQSPDVWCIWHGRTWQGRHLLYSTQPGHECFCVTVF